MDITPFHRRRAQLQNTMGAGVAVIPSANEKLRNRDSYYPYRADSYFHYLCGFPEPEAVLVLVAGSEPKSILFCREKDPEKEIWEGFRFGPEAACEAFGVTEAYSLAMFDERFAEILANQPTLWFSLGHDAAWDARIGNALNALRAGVRDGKHAPTEIRDVRTAIDAMRLVKDEQEIAVMRRAAAISARAHHRAMRAAAPGKYEYQLEAELLHEFRASGCQAPAYGSIVAGGANACILHYVDNNRPLGDGDLVLIDAGCELDCYASDISRTFPVSGRFRGPQADIYRLVLAAQAAAVEAIRPGADFHEPHAAALTVLAQGMADLKLLPGSAEDIIESEAYKRFYMHRTSHWLGLDVHDAGDYKDGDQWKTLQPGMVLTVEPGCYIRAADDVPAAFHGIGVRIEDDALVTANGCELITSEAVKRIEDIEALMAG